MRFGDLEEPHVGLKKGFISRLHDLDCAWLPVPVFDDCDTEQDFRFCNLNLRHSPNGIPEYMAVRLMSADLFAEADGAHLEQTGRKFPYRFRVRFGAAQ